MSAGSPEVILAVALKAAEASTIYSEEGHSSVKDIGILNEQWAQSFVGDAISRHLLKEYAHVRPQPYVTYETKASWIAYYLKTAPGPYALQLTDNSRFDITVWRKSNGISGLIEIKDDPVMSNYSRSRDTPKIIGALRRWKDLSWGIVLYSTRATSQLEDEAELLSHIDKKRKAVEKTIRKVSKPYRCHFEHRDSDISTCKYVHWSGAIIRRPV